MISIDCNKISIKKLYYTCPFCFTNGKKVFNSKYFKNGKEAISRQPTIHHHGNETQKLDNFTTHRSSHCTFSNEDVELHITDNTERIP